MTSEEIENERACYVQIYSTRRTDQNTREVLGEARRVAEYASERALYHSCFIISFREWLQSKLGTASYYRIHSKPLHFCAKVLRQDTR